MICEDQSVAGIQRFQKVVLRTFKSLRVSLFVHSDIVSDIAIGCIMHIKLT